MREVFSRGSRLKFVFVSHEAIIFTPGTPISHVQSLWFSCLTSSARSTRTLNPTSLLFPSHGDDRCDDPGHVATFGRLAEWNSPTGHEPNDLTEMNNTEVTPIFCHRPSVTSTNDSAESIAASFLNRIWTMSRYGTC